MIAVAFVVSGCHATASMSVNSPITLIRGADDSMQDAVPTVSPVTTRKGTALVNSQSDTPRKGVNSKIGRIDHARPTHERARPPVRSDKRGYLTNDDLATRLPRYRLEAVTSSIPDLIATLGGWLCDRAMSGWDVTVLSAGGQGAAAIAMLGGHVGDLDTALASSARPFTNTIVIAADLYVNDPRIKRRVGQAIRGGQTEVVLWGSDWTADARSPQFIRVRHECTTVAHRFKRCALMSLNNEANVGPVEELYVVPTGHSQPTELGPVANSTTRPPAPSRVSETRRRGGLARPPWHSRTQLP